MCWHYWNNTFGWYTSWFGCNKAGNWEERDHHHLWRYIHFYFSSKCSLPRTAVLSIHWDSLHSVYSKLYPSMAHEYCQVFESETKRQKVNTFKGCPVVITYTFHSLSFGCTCAFIEFHEIYGQPFTCFYWTVVLYCFSKQPHHAEFSRLCVWQDMTVWFFCKDRIIWVWKTVPQGFCCLSKV